MNHEDQIEQVEVSIEHAKELINAKKALLRLTNNKDFEDIVLKGYFKEEASRLVLLKADPSMQDDREAIQISKSIDAIGYVRQYFNTIMQLGNTAERGLAEDELTREELLTEAL